jgi:hypothetical protein
MICKECKDSFEKGKGHSLDPDSPEEFCSYKCVETAKRHGIAGLPPELAEILEKIQQILPVDTQMVALGPFNSNGVCECDDCKESRKQEERENEIIAKNFDKNITEMSQVEKVLLVRSTNSAMREKNLQAGDVMVYCDKNSYSTNSDFFKTLKNPKCILQSHDKSSDIFAFGPTGSRHSIIGHILSNMLNDIQLGDENESIKITYSTKIQSCLGIMSDNKEWIGIASSIIHDTAVNFFGPRATGHLTSEDDLDIMAI